MMKGLFPVVTNSDFVFPDTIFDNFFNGFENPTEANYRVPQVDIEHGQSLYPDDGSAGCREKTSTSATKMTS